MMQVIIKINSNKKKYMYIDREKERDMNMIERTEQKVVLLSDGVSLQKGLGIEIHCTVSKKKISQN